jgi:hypothetical protein
VATSPVVEVEVQEARALLAQQTREETAELVFSPESLE